PRLPAVLPRTPRQPHLRTASPRGRRAATGRSAAQRRCAPGQPPHRENHTMTLIGLDLNATRARAVAGAVEDVPELAALEPPRADLALALSLEGEPTVGAAGLRLAR